MDSTIEFVSKEFLLPFPQESVIEWIEQTIEQESKTLGTITYVFMNDEELLKYNVEYLEHDYYTDIITFDDSEFPEINGDILISYDRVKDNALTHGNSFENELFRVIIHGVLHLCGYADKSEKDAKTMREKEDFYLAKMNKFNSTFHVKQSE